MTDRTITEEHHATDTWHERLAEVSPWARSEAETLAQAQAWLRSQPAARWTRVARILERYAPGLAQIEDDERARLSDLLAADDAASLAGLRSRVAEGLATREPGIAGPRLRVALLDGLVGRLELLVPDWRAALGRAPRTAAGGPELAHAESCDTPSADHDWHRRLEVELGRQLGAPVQIGGSRRLQYGVCNSVFAVEATVDGAPRRLCVRADGPMNRCLALLPKSVEREVIALVRARGVPCAAPLAVVPSPVGEGEALVSEWFVGEGRGREIVCSPALETARSGLAQAMAGALAAIHRLGAGEQPALLPAEPSPLFGDGSVAAALDLLAPRDGVACTGYLALEQHAVYAWLVEHRPPEAEARLIHGDFRVGNLLVATDGRMVVLDWESSHWGDPHRDLANAALPHVRFDRPDRGFAGLCDLDEFIALYREADGPAVDRARLHWWRVYLCLWMSVPTSDWNFIEQSDLAGAWEVPLGLEAMFLAEALLLIAASERGEPG